MKQGQSSETPLKESHFADMFSFNIELVKNIAVKQPWARTVYHHFDLYAGSGYNDDAECEGSPLAFARAALDSSFQSFSAHFVERDKTRAWRLRSRLLQFELPSWFNWHVHCLGNAEFLQLRLPCLIRARNEYAYGTILLDDNGSKYPLNELRDTISVYPRIDLLINYPATARLRCRDAGFLQRNILPMKEHWLVTQPHGPYRWTRLMGRNYGYGSWGRIWHRHDQHPGREILKDADRTKAESEAEQDAKQLSLL